VRRGRALRRRYGRSGTESVYDRLVAAGCNIDHHESDLYVEATPEARAITAGEKNRSFFRSQVDGKTWIDIPFAYAPFWAAKAR
jgi:hypothetical protein